MRWPEFRLGAVSPCSGLANLCYFANQTDNAEDTCPYTWNKRSKVQGLQLIIVLRFYNTSQRARRTRVPSDDATTANHGVTADCSYVLFCSDLGFGLIIWSPGAKFQILCRVVLGICS